MREVFRMDSRALSLFRIALGVFALCDLYLRLTMGIEWYTDASDPACAQNPLDTPHLGPPHRIMFYRGSRSFQTCCFGCHVGLAVLFLLGIGGRAVTALLWAFTICMHGRSEGFNDGSDAVFRLVLAWGALLPLDRHWALSLSHASKGDDGCVLSWGSVGMLVQIPMVYWGVIGRRNIESPEWFNGSAVFYSLAASLGTTPLARHAVLNLDSRVFALVTHATVLLEIIGPAILFLTTIRTRWRVIPIALIASLHLGIAPLIHLPQFQTISLISLIPTLPSSLLDLITSQRKQKVEPTPTTSRIQPSLSRNTPSHTLRARKRTQHTFERKQDTTLYQDIDKHDSEPQRLSTSVWLGMFMVAYSVAHFLSYNFQLFEMPEEGNIGELFRFRQTWRMYANLQKQNDYWLVVGDVNMVNHTTHYNVFRSLRDASWTPMSEKDLEAVMSPPDSVTATFPNWRYERWFFSPPSDSRLHWLARHLCSRLANGLHAFDGDHSIRYQRWTWATLPIPALSVTESLDLHTQIYSEVQKVTDLSVHCSKLH